jgi:hypothetical protein
MFLVGLSAALTALIVFGLGKASLGLDFTDEGLYLAAPLRLHFGESIFSSEIMTLSRPFEIFPALILKFFPGADLYEFRLVGWAIHLTAYAAVSLACFQIHRSPWLSLLVPAIPFFCSNAIAVSTPSYNNLSSDFLLIALSLRILAVARRRPGGLILCILSGFLLFAAVSCYPTLIFAAGILMILDWRFFWPGMRLENPPLTPGPAASLAFALSCLIFALFLFFSGALHHWLGRIHLAQAFLLTSVRSRPIYFYPELFLFLLSLTPFFRIYATISLVVVIAIIALRKCRPEQLRPKIFYWYGAFSIAGFIYVFIQYNFCLLAFFCLSSLTAAVVYFLPAAGLRNAGSDAARVAVLASVAAALVYATSTAYWQPYYSWYSGALGLPACFSIAVSSLFSGGAEFARVRKLGAGVALGAAALCAGYFYYHRVYRDAVPNELTAEFKSAKLRRVRSTPERVLAVDELVAYLKPKLSYGEPLIAYDGCPMLYFLLDAHPAYGLAWARKYRISKAALVQLDSELEAKPLPRYAVRAMVDLSEARWAGAPRETFDDYPLNGTILKNYVLEKTIFPFEIWRLKSAGR